LRPLGGQRHGGQHGLVAELSQEEGHADGQDHGAGRLSGPRLVARVERIATQRPGSEDEEGQPGHDRDPNPSAGPTPL